jgi:hypothetical protein
MKNTTRVRLHLSKNLFESLAQQVIAEAKKNYGAGMEEVKMKKDKAPKSEKVQEKKEEDTAKDKVEEKKKMEEMEGGDEEKVTITLNEFTGDPSMLELGQWVVDNYPAIAKAISSSAAEDPDQRLVDLGMQVLQLATAGSVGIAAGLAVAKDHIVNAAKKVKSMLGGKKGAVAEADDAELAQILAKLPDDMKGKV